MKDLIVPILTLMFATSVYAQDAERVATETRISKQSATETGDRGLFTVPSAETLNKGQFSFGTAWTNIDRSPHDLDITTVPVFFSIGVTGRLTVTGHFDARREIAARFLSQGGFTNQYPFVNSHYVADRGDATLAAKFRLQRRSDNIGGMSIRGYVKFPTADEVKGLGTGATDVGADLIFTAKLPLSVVMDSAIGFTWTEKATDPVTHLKRHLKDQIRSGIGLSWPASGIDAGGRLQGIAEYSSLTFVGAGTSNAADSTENPSDLTGGVRYLLLGSGITMTAGYRTNTRFDRGFPGSKDWRGFTGSVTFSKPVRGPINNRFPVVSLESSSDDIRVGDSATITATGYDPDNDTLTYSWIASAGRVNATGDKATFTTTGLAPGKYTIRATASDGKGGTATSLIDVNVRP